MSALKNILFVFLILLSSVVVIAQQTIPKDTLITLERSPCFGTCPWYKITITADGKVEFEPYSFGDNYKVVSGKIIKSKISQDKLKQIISLFERIKYFSLEDQYGSVDYEPDKNCPEMWTDNRTVTTSIKINGKSKEVSHYHGCRGSKFLDELTKFENEIEEIVGFKFDIRNPQIINHYENIAARQETRILDDFFNQLAGRLGYRALIFITDDKNLKRRLNFLITYIGKRKLDPADITFQIGRGFSFKTALYLSPFFSTEMPDCYNCTYVKADDAKTLRKIFSLRPKN